MKLLDMRKYVCAFLGFMKWGLQWFIILIQCRNAENALPSVPTQIMTPLAFLITSCHSKQGFAANKFFACVLKILVFAKCLNAIP